MPLGEALGLLPRLAQLNICLGLLNGPLQKQIFSKINLIQVKRHREWHYFKGGMYLSKKYPWIFPKLDISNAIIKTAFECKNTIWKSSLEMLKIVSAKRLADNSISCSLWFWCTQEDNMPQRPFQSFSAFTNARLPFSIKICC